MIIINNNNNNNNNNIYLINHVAVADVAAGSRVETRCPLHKIPSHFAASCLVSIWAGFDGWRFKEGQGCSSLTRF